MNTSYQTFSDSVRIIKKELSNKYDKNEINSFIRIIFKNLLNYSSTDIHINQNTKISSNSISEINLIIEQLKQNKPIQYIFGETDFYDLEFYVNEHVLIPRPETEELVDWIIKETVDKYVTILDIGTGSGCIAITLSKNLDNPIIEAIDISKKALIVAKNNAKKYSQKINYKRLDILNLRHQKKLGKYDLIVSNPPYVTVSDKKEIHKNVIDYEPHDALFISDNNPLVFFEVISKFAKGHLNKNGKLFFEINELYGTEALNKIWSFGFSEIILKKDLNGKERMIKASI